MEVAPFFTSAGTEPSVRDQNQTLMNELVRSIAYLGEHIMVGLMRFGITYGERAYQPPPALLKAGP